MDIFQMTDLEIYELGIKELTKQLGPAYTTQFLQNCKPRTYDYTVERHKWMDNDPDIRTLAKRIQQKAASRKEEERLKAKRIAAWREGMLELTDLEIYELGFKILADELKGYGLLRFIRQHFKQL